MIWFYLYVCAAAAAKSLQSCPTLYHPIDAAHQALPSLGFSGQEHCSGLPFPSPMHESEKWKWSRSIRVCYFLSRVPFFVTPWTVASQAPLSMEVPRQEPSSGLAIFFSRGSSWHTDWNLPALQADSSPSEPPTDSKSSIHDFQSL